MNNTPTFSFAVNERTDEQRAVIALINAHHERRKSGASESLLRESEQAILGALAEFASTTTHSNPEWVSRALAGEAYMSFGDIPAAIEKAWESTLFAKDRLQLAKTFNNLCEYYRQGGDYAKAAAYGEAATRLSEGKNLGMLITWAEALYKAGDKAKAQSILAKVADVSDVNKPGDVLGTHLRYEDQLRQMTDLKIVKQLIDSLH